MEKKSVKSLYSNAIRNTLIPIGLSSGLFFLRERVLIPWCAADPTPCVKSEVNALDQIAFQYASVRADFWSNVLQNTVGTLYFLTPFFLAGFRRLSWGRAGLDGLHFLRNLFWNFFIMEVVRAIVQRPRPLVYNAPWGDGLNVHQYTSFYSGHTSFVALATLSLALYIPQVLERTGQSGKKWSGLLWTLATVCICLTGLLRVWGGRHYPTDVLVGALAGGLLAWFLRIKPE